MARFYNLISKIPLWVLLSLILLVFQGIFLPRTILATELDEMRRMAEHGHVKAQLQLGQSYYEGKRVKQDYKMAMVWFRQAADQGDAEAQNSVGTLYDNGKGVPKDYPEAAKWFRLAANQGHVLARRNLGWMYEKGQGFAKDYVLSYMWHYLAEMAHSSKQGSTGDMVWKCKLCDAVAKKMTQNQITQAKEMARNWQPEKNNRLERGYQVR